MHQNDATRVSASRRSPAARIVAAALAAIFALAAAPAFAAGWSVSGQVTFANGSPASGATVRLRLPSGSEVSTLSDANGNYSLSSADETPGSALLSATKGTCSSPTNQVFERDVTQSLTLSGNPGDC